MKLSNLGLEPVHQPMPHLWLMEIIASHATYNEYLYSVSVCINLPVSRQMLQGLTLEELEALCGCIIYYEFSDT